MQFARILLRILLPKSQMQRLRHWQLRHTPVILQITTEKYHDGSLYIGQIKDGSAMDKESSSIRMVEMFDEYWSTEAMNWNGHLYYASGRLAYEDDIKNDFLAGSLHMRRVVGAL
eukprot:TRINITY_DN8191_c0_g1_i5.p1 TRINITY_DN8191_c0_g1~~TRINITY_DN8191_c0_g1_i5.p1  ORF type:complete len:115 (-),score=8.00 TRINITY_DN8191_c0_g1_i5:28-372(-)